VSEDPLYAKDVLRLAASAAGAGRIEPHDAAGEARNPICGDRVSVTLAFGELGTIEALAHETHACVLAQASAALLARHLPGADRQVVETLQESVQAMLKGGTVPLPPFADYALLRGVAAHRNRHRCVLLPIEAVLAALRASGSGQ
jgi:NifU-like protein involved in Fe-S cluster formation